jgi:ketosteroid isomerase-like protein
MAMDPAEEFRTVVMKKFAEAERAMHAGEPELRIALWSHQDPVTLLGAATPIQSGWATLEPVFRWVASRFTAVDDYKMELLACQSIGDMGYTVAFEHVKATMRGEAVQYTLRATHVWRREDGEWRIVHRHGDSPPPDEYHGQDH